MQRKPVNMHARLKAIQSDRVYPRTHQVEKGRGQDAPNVASHGNGQNLSMPRGLALSVPECSRSSETRSLHTTQRRVSQFRSGSETAKWSPSILRKGRPVAVSE